MSLVRHRWVPLVWIWVVFAPIPNKPRNPIPWSKERNAGPRGNRRVPRSRQGAAEWTARVREAAQAGVGVGWGEARFSGYLFKTVWCHFSGFVHVWRLGGSVQNSLGSSERLPLKQFWYTLGSESDSLPSTQLAKCLADCEAKSCALL